MNRAAKFTLSFTLALCLTGAMAFALTLGGWEKHESVEFKNNDGAFFAVSFDDTSTGWAVRSGVAGSGVYKTSDGGSSWTTDVAQPGEWGLTPDALSVISTDHVWILDGSELVFTTDGARTWRTNEPIGPDANHQYSTYRDIFFLDAEHGWVCNERGQLARTTDGGESWVTVKLQDGGQAPVLGGIRFLDAQRGFAVGTLHPAGEDAPPVAVVFATKDGGATWTSKRIPGFWYLLDLDFADKSNGWISGVTPDYRGSVLRTVDGGVTWTKQVVGSPGWLEDIAAVSKSEAYACGSYSPYQMYRTTDGGTTWKPTRMPGPDGQVVEWVAAGPAGVWATVRAESVDGSWLAKWNPTGTPVATKTPRLTKSPGLASYTLTRVAGKAYWTFSATVFDPSGRVLPRHPMRLETSKDGKKWVPYFGFDANSNGKASYKIKFTTKGTSYWRWRAAATQLYSEKATSATRVIVK